MISEDLPLFDLHRHLDGNIRLETMLELASAHNLSLPAHELEALRPHVQITEPQPGLPGFLERVALMASVLADIDACRRIAYENIEDACRAGLDYAELRFSPGFMGHAHRLDPSAVVEAVVDGTRAGAEVFGFRVGLIGIMSRTFGPESARRELNAFLGWRDALVAIDLAGDEALWPGEYFKEHFRRGRDAGWRITVHAGESVGPESIWQALRELQASRIGHGVRAAEDPRLLDYMAEHGIGVESCLTSNVQTSTVESFESHPLRDFLDRGILATINTDDPVVSGIDLRHEYEVAAPAAGLTPVHARRAQQNALEVAFPSAGLSALLEKKRGIE